MRKSAFLIFVLLLSTLATIAQNRCFKAYDSQGREVTTFCIGEPITFRDCAGIDSDKEYYDYDKSNGVDFEAPEAARKTFTYTKPGKVIVTQYGNLDGVNGSFEREFEVMDNTPPSFTIKACSNNSVQVTIAASGFDRFEINYNNERTITASQSGPQPTYTFTGTGERFISVTGVYTDSRCTAVKSNPVPFIPNYIPPTLSRLRVNKQDAGNGEIELTLDGLSGIYTYTIERSTGGAFTKVADITDGQGTKTITLRNLNTAVSAQYRVMGTNNCGQVQQASNQVTNIVLNAAGGNEQATLNWQTIANTYQRYTISYNFYSTLPDLPGSATSYTHTGLSCGVNYCYTIAGYTTDGNATSISAEHCVAVTSANTPKAGNLVASFNEQNQVVLTLQPSQGQTIKTVTFQRSIEGEPYSTIGTPAQPGFTDETITPRPVCYRATYTNACEQTAPVSNTACPVILVARQPNDETVILGWTGYVGFTEGIANYTLEVLDQDMQLMRSYTLMGNTYTDKLTDEEAALLNYRVKVTSKSGAISYSNTETITQELNLYIPSAFTPNGDGLNDLFEIKGRLADKVTMRIMNSAGQVLYTATDRTGWDGTFKGRPQPAGVYAYEVIATTRNGATKRRTGTVTLIR